MLPARTGLIFLNSLAFFLFSSISSILICNSFRFRSHSQLLYLVMPRKTIEEMMRMCDDDSLPRSLEKVVWGDDQNSDALIAPGHQGFEMPSSSHLEASFGGGRYKPKVPAGESRRMCSQIGPLPLLEPITTQQALHADSILSSPFLAELPLFLIGTIMPHPFNSMGLYKTSVIPRACFLIVKSTQIPGFHRPLARLQPSDWRRVRPRTA